MIRSGVARVTGFLANLRAMRGRGARKKPTGSRERLYTHGSESPESRRPHSEILEFSVRLAEAKAGLGATDHVKRNEIERIMRREIGPDDMKKVQRVSEIYSTLRLAGKTKGWATNFLQNLLEHERELEEL